MTALSASGMQTTAVAFWAPSIARLEQCYLLHFLLTERSSSPVMHIRERPSSASLSYLVVLGNNDATVRSWALNTPVLGQLSALSTYLGHAGPVRTVAYASMGDSERIVSGSDDAEIAIWDGDSDKPVRKICGHEAAILSISVSGDKVFSSSKDKTIRVWDLNTGDNISIIRG